MDITELNTLERRCAEARVHTLRAVNRFGFGHVGGALSMVEALITLYFKELRIDPANKDWPDRDRFVLSKGHCGPALYTVLAMRGYFPLEELQTLNQPGTRLPSHCDRLRTPGIDMTAGSLGQGLSAAVGMALGARMDDAAWRVYCIIGDGEAQEGQIWEASMLAGQHRLGNLTVLLDDNGLQLDDHTSAINAIRPVDKRWEAFGWEVVKVNGHDIRQLVDAMAYARTVTDRPTLIHMVTSKAKGLPAAEGTVASHSMPVTPEDIALAEARLATFCAQEHRHA